MTREAALMIQLAFVMTSTAFLMMLISLLIFSNRHQQNDLRHRWRDSASSVMMFVFLVMMIVSLIMVTVFSVP